MTPISRPKLVALAIVVWAGSSTAVAGDLSSDYSEKRRELGVEVSEPAAAVACRAGSVAVSWKAAGTKGVTFRAVGQGPGWVLELDEARCLRFAVHRAEPLVLPLGPERIDDVKSGGALYGTRATALELEIGIERRGCQDYQSGTALTHAVTVRLNGQEYRGCGRVLSHEVADSH